MSINLLTASQIPEVVLDCVVNPFLANAGKTASGGAATDNTAAINQALLSLAAVGVGSVKLILDGGTLTSGITLPTLGNYEIEGSGWGAGIYIASGSNADPINNGKILPFDPATTPPASGQYVRLSNFTINGNRGNGFTGDSTSGQPQGISGTYWYCNINLANLAGVRIENVFSYDSPAYSIRLNNCADIYVAGCTIYNPNVTVTGNQDSIHIDGPASDIRIIGNYMDNNGSDDAIALNAPEGYSGLITRAVIMGNTFQNVATALRVYGGVSGSASGIVDTVVFAGNIGNAFTDVVTIGGPASTSGDTQCRVFIAADNIFECTGYYFALAGSIGDVTLKNCVWQSPTVGGKAFVLLNGTVVSSLTIGDLHIYRNTLGHDNNSPLLGGSGTVQRMTINGFQVIDEEGQSYSPIASVLAMSGATITKLFIGSLDYTNITALTDTYTGITSISGAWQPDTNIQSKTGAYTLLPTDRTVLASTTGGRFAVALPATAYVGQKHTIKNTGTANTLTITGTVDGSANPTLATLAKMTVEYDGTHWWSV